MIVRKTPRLNRGPGRQICHVWGSLYPDYDRAQWLTVFVMPVKSGSPKRFVHVSTRMRPRDRVKAAYKRNYWGISRNPNKFSF